MAQTEAFVEEGEGESPRGGGLQFERREKAEDKNELSCDFSHTSKYL